MTAGCEACEDTGWVRHDWRNAVVWCSCAKGQAMKAARDAKVAKWAKTKAKAGGAKRDAA